MNCKVFDLEFAVLHVGDGDELIPSKPYYANSNDEDDYAIQDDNQEGCILSAHFLSACDPDIINLT